MLRVAKSQSSVVEILLELVPDSANAHPLEPSLLSKTVKIVYGMNTGSFVSGPDILQSLNVDSSTARSLMHLVSNFDNRALASPTLSSS